MARILYQITLSILEGGIFVWGRPTMPHITTASKQGAVVNLCSQHCMKFTFIIIPVKKLCTKCLKCCEVPGLLPQTNVEIGIPMGKIRLADVLLLQCSRMNDGDNSDGK